MNQETAVKAPRRYAFACISCRRKKIRCNGEQPNCKSCLRSNEPCEYPQRSVAVQLQHANTRIRELEDDLRDARQTIDTMKMELARRPHGGQSQSLDLLQPSQLTNIPRNMPLCSTCNNPHPQEKPRSSVYWSTTSDYATHSHSNAYVDEYHCDTDAIETNFTVEAIPNTIGAQVFYSFDDTAALSVTNDFRIHITDNHTSTRSGPYSAGMRNG